jgi:uncharacterized protein (TIGR02118 family)
MHKLVVVLRGWQDSERVEREWSEAFVPLAEQMAGLRRVSVSRTAGSPSGPADVILLHELFFDDLASLQAAMVSPAGQAAGRALMQLAAGRVELFFAEHQEMALDRPSAPGTA